MDTAHSLDGSRPDRNATGDGEAPPSIGTDERRMQVRAYNFWVSLLKGRAFPAIADLDPATVRDFGAHGVLLDFSRDVENPVIAYLGGALRHECALGGSTTHVAQVPPRSLLSRLTDHHLQIIATKAPVGFEAEFVTTRGQHMLYRGILMPFSSDGETIDFIYGVINWKERVDAATEAALAGELAAAIRPEVSAPAEPVWADGPAADARAGGLVRCLTLARESAASARNTDSRSRIALYRALGRAHDFALEASVDPGGYRQLLAEAGIKPRAGAPMTPVVKLVFGTDYDKTRLTEFARVLAHARRTDVPAGGLAAMLEEHPGGIKALVTAERAASGSAPRRSAVPSAIVDRAVIARVEADVKAENGAMMVFVARANGTGRFDILGVLDDPRLVARAIRATEPSRQP